MSEDTDSRFSRLADEFEPTEEVDEGVDDPFEKFTPLAVEDEEEIEEEYDPAVASEGPTDPPLPEEGFTRGESHDESSVGEDSRGNDSPLPHEVLQKDLHDPLRPSVKGVSTTAREDLSKEDKEIDDIISAMMDPARTPEGRKMEHPPIRRAGNSVSDLMKRGRESLPAKFQLARATILALSLSATFWGGLKIGSASAPPEFVEVEGRIETLVNQNPSVIMRERTNFREVSGIVSAPQTDLLSSPAFSSRSASYQEGSIHGTKLLYEKLFVSTTDAEARMAVASAALDLGVSQNDPSYVKTAIEWLNVIPEAQGDYRAAEAYAKGYSFMNEITPDALSAVKGRFERNVRLFNSLAESKEITAIGHGWSEELQMSFASAIRQAHPSGNTHQGNADFRAGWESAVEEALQEYNTLNGSRTAESAVLFKSSSQKR